MSGLTSSGNPWYVQVVGIILFGVIDIYVTYVAWKLRKEVPENL